MVARGAPKADQYGGPKKPASGSYFMWCNDNREVVMTEIRKKCEAESKKFDVTEVGRTLAERYKAQCTDEQKKVYNEKSEVLKKEYSEKLAAWKATDQYAEFQKAKATFDKKSTGRKEKKELKEAGQPNKPKTAYLYFVNENRPEVTAQLKKEHGDAFKIGMVAGRSAELWKKLSSQDKIPYEKKAAEDKAQYAEALAAFKEYLAFITGTASCGPAILEISESTFFVSMEKAGPSLTKYPISFKKFS
jgi:high mobility group protein B1